FRRRATGLAPGPCGRRPRFLVVPRVAVRVAEQLAQHPLGLREEVTGVGPVAGHGVSPLRRPPVWTSEPRSAARTVTTLTPPSPRAVVRAGSLWGCLAVMDG